MAVVPPHGLAVFVDWSPSEQIAGSNNPKHCAVAVACNSATGIPELRFQFKGAARKVRLRRIREAQAAMDARDVGIRAYGVAIRESTARPIVDYVLAAGLAEIGARWEADGKCLSWRAYRYPKAQVLGLGMYAFILPLLAARVATWLEPHEDLDRATLFLDRLPLDSSAGKMLLDEIVRTSVIAPLINRVSSVGPCLLRTAFLIRSRHPSIGQLPGKRDPQFIVADWLAASLRAGHEPAAFLPGGGGNLRSSEEVQRLSALWTTLERQRHVTSDDLDAPHWTERISQSGLSGDTGR